MIFRDDMIDLEGQAVAFLRNLAVFAAMTGSLPYQFLQRAFHRAHCARGFFPSTRRFLSDRRAFDRLNPPQATRLQPVVRRVSPAGLQPVPLSRRSGISKLVMIIVNDACKRASP